MATFPKPPRVPNVGKINMDGGHLLSSGPKFGRNQCDYTAPACPISRINQYAYTTNDMSTRTPTFLDC